MLEAAVRFRSSFVRDLLAASLFALLSACSSSSDDGGKTRDGAAGTSGGSYATCDVATRAGHFYVNVTGGDIDVEGSVYDGPEVSSPAEQVKAFGACRLMRHATAVAPCSPACSVTQVCLQNTCKPKPTPQNLGKVTVAGLSVPLELAPLPPGFVYFRPNEVRPALASGAAITLQATGANGYGPFSLAGVGIEPLQAPSTPLEVQDGKAVKLTWTPQAKSGPTRVLINFSVNVHGATDSWFECEAPDSGDFTIEAALMTELFKQGLSGFPRATLTRQTASTTTVKSGCVELLVSAEVTRDLEVPGLLSCQTDDDCPTGKTCRDDRVCK